MSDSQGKLNPKFVSWNAQNLAKKIIENVVFSENFTKNVKRLTIDFYTENLVNFDTILDQLKPCKLFRNLKLVKYKIRIMSIELLYKFLTQEHENGKTSVWGRFNRYRGHTIVQKNPHFLIKLKNSTSWTFIKGEELGVQLGVGDVETIDNSLILITNYSGIEVQKLTRLNEYDSKFSHVLDIDDSVNDIDCIILDMQFTSLGIIYSCLYDKIPVPIIAEELELGINDIADDSIRYFGEYLKGITPDGCQKIKKIGLNLYIKIETEYQFINELLTVLERFNITNLYFSMAPNDKDIDSKFERQLYPTITKGFSKWSKLQGIDLDFSNDYASKVKLRFLNEHKKETVLSFFKGDITLQDVSKELSEDEVDLNL